MAAVTTASNEVLQSNVRWRKFVITGATGDTLATQMIDAFFVDISPGSTITAVAYSTVNGTTTITFTSSGPIVAETIIVWARA